MTISSDSFRVVHIGIQPSYSSITAPSPSCAHIGRRSTCDIAKWSNDVVYGSAAVTAKFFDRQDSSNPINGVLIGDACRLSDILRDLSKRPPFFGELLAENGFELLIGIGRPVGCVQYSHPDGTPPYLMAVSDEPRPHNQDVDFLIGDCRSPVPARYCIPFSRVEEIAIHFLKTGARSPAVNWEAI